MLSMRERAQQEGNFSMKEAADRAGVCYKTLRRYVEQGLVYPRVESHPDALGYRYWFCDRDVERIRETLEDNLSWLKIGLREFVERRRQRIGQ